MSYRITVTDEAIAALPADSVHLLEVAIEVAGAVIVSHAHTQRYLITGPGEPPQELLDAVPPAATITTGVIDP